MDKTKQFGIGEAVKELKNDAIVQRAGWNGKGMYLELISPPADSRMTQSFVAIRNAHGDYVPWNASQEDLLAVDWQLA